MLHEDSEITHGGSALGHPVGESHPWSPCVGREGELLALRNLIDESVRNHHRAVALVTGPVGIGKSYLLDELARRERARGIATYQGFSRFGDPPYAPVADLVESGVASLVGLGAEELIAEGRALAAALRPSLRGLPTAPQPRLLTFERTRAFLCSVAERSPSGALFLIHDLHVADAATCALVAHLVRGFAHDADLAPQSASAGVLLVMGRVLDASLQSSASAYVRLQPWSVESLQAYLTRPGMAEKLLQLTGGVPGRLDRMLALAGTEPDQLVSGALGMLGTAAARLVRGLAIIGRPVLIGTLSSLASNEIDPSLPIHELSQSPLVCCTVDTDGIRLRFAREADREAVIAAMPLAERCALHLAVGRALSAAGDHPAAVAEHLLHGGATAEGVQCVLAAIPALQASQAYERGLALLRLAGRQGGDSPEAVQIDTLTMKVGELAGDYAAALAANKNLLSRLAHGDDRRRGLLARKGRLHLLCGELQAAHDALSLAVTESRHAGDQEQALEAMAALAETQLLQASQRARCTAHEVLAETVHGERAALARLSALNTLGRSHLEVGEYEDAAAYFQQKLDGSRVRGIVDQVIGALVNLGIVALRTGHLEQAEERYREALVLSEESKDLRQRAFCVQNLGVLAQWRRDYRTALAHYQDAVVAFKQLGHRPWMAWVVLDLGDLYIDLEDFVQAAAMGDLAGRLLGETPPIMAQIILTHFRGRLALHRGYYDESACLLEAAEQLASQVKSFDERDLTRVFLAELYCRRGAPQRALALLLSFEPSSARLRAQREVGLARALLLAGRAEESLSMARDAERAWAAQGDDEGRLQALILRAEACQALARRSEAARVREVARTLDQSLRTRVPLEFAPGYGRDPGRLRLQVHAIQDMGPVGTAGAGLEGRLQRETQK